MEWAAAGGLISVEYMERQLGWVTEFEKMK